MRTRFVQSRVTAGHRGDNGDQGIIFSNNVFPPFDLWEDSYGLIHHDGQKHTHMHTHEHACTFHAHTMCGSGVPLQLGPYDYRPFHFIFMSKLPRMGYTHTHIINIPFTHTHTLPLRCHPFSHCPVHTSSRSTRGEKGECKQTLPRSRAPVSAFRPSWLGGHGNMKRQGPCVNKEQWFNTMRACLQTTLLTDIHTKEPVNGKEACAHIHAREHTHTQDKE